MMKIRGMAKIGTISLLSVLALALIIFLTSLAISHSGPQNEQYNLGDPVKITLPNGGASIKITTPSGNALIKKTEESSLIFTPKETGLYNIRISDSNKKESFFEFEVLTSVEPSFETSVSNFQKLEDSPNSTDSNEQNKTDSLENLNGTIIAGEMVFWKQKIISNGSLEVNLPKRALNPKAFKNGQEIQLTSEEPSEFTFKTAQAKNNNKLHLNESGEIEIFYQTEAPKIIQEKISDKKFRVEVSADHDLNYTNVETKVQLDTELTPAQANNFQILWKEENKTLPFTTLDTDSNGKIDHLHWIVPHLSTQTFEVELKVLNVQSYPIIGGNWKVDFTTIGKADLTIKGINDTAFNKDLRFLELKCGDQNVEYQTLGNKIFVENYECNEISSEISRVLTPGKHDLEFNFGNSTDYAHNFAGQVEGYRTQQGTYDMSGTDEYIPLDFPVENISHAFVIAPNQMNQENVTAATAGDPAANDDNSFITLYLYNTTHIRAQRRSSADGTFVVTWQVLEAANKEFTVQRGEHNYVGSTTTTSDTIPNAVTPENSMSWFYIRTTYTTRQGDVIQFFSNITDSTTIQFEREHSGTSTTIDFRWVVVEWDVSKVNSFQKGYTGLINGDDTAPDCFTLGRTINKSSSILLFHSHAYGDDGLDASTRAGYIKDSDEVCFYDYYGGNTAGVKWFLLDIPGVTKREEDTHLLWSSSATAEEDVSFASNFSENQTLAWVSGTCDGDGTAKPRHTQWWSLTRDSGNLTALHIERTYTGQPREFSWQAIELPFYHNPDYPQFSNTWVDKTYAKSGEAVRFSVNITDASDSIIAPNGTINGVNYSLSNEAGDEWYYEFTCAEADSGIGFTFAEAEDNGYPVNYNSSTLTGQTLTCDDQVPQIIFNESSEVNNTFTPHDYIYAAVNATEINLDNITYNLYELGTSYPNWFNGSWENRKEVTIPSSNVDSDLEDFILFIETTDLNFRDNARSDGNDFLFVQNNQILPFEIESYNTSNGKLVAWTKLNLSSSADNTFYIYYDNPSQSTSLENSSKVWEDYYLSIHSDSSFTDSSNKMTLTNNGVTFLPTGGHDGNGAYDFDGGTDYIDLSDININGEFTISFWAKWDSFDQWSRIIDFANGAPSNNILVANLATTNELIFEIYNGGTSTGLFSGGTTLTSGQYDHYTVTGTTNDFRWYKNGVNIANKTTGALPNDVTRTNVYIGRSNWGSDQYFNGEISEISISNSVFSADFVRTSHENQNDSSSFFTLAAQENRPSPVESFEIYNSTSYSTLIKEINWTNLPSGEYFYNITIADLAGQTNATETRKITLDVDNPQISFGLGTEVNNSNKSQNFVYVNVSVIETHEQNITFRLYNSSHDLIRDSTFTDQSRTIQWNSLTEQTYYYEVFIYDKTSRYNSTGRRTINLDLSNPNATLTVPENDTHSNQTSQNLTVNATDKTGLENATLYIYNETDLINQTTVAIDGTEALLGIIYEFVYDGIFNWFYRIYDVAGNPDDSQNHTITIDTTYPQISFTSPTENSGVNKSQTWIFANVSITEINEANITFFLYNRTALVNQTTYSTAQRTINWTNLPNEIYSYNVSVTDLSSQTNSTETRQITLDTRGPEINIINPESRAYGYDTGLYFNYTVDDDLTIYDVCLWNLNNTANQTIVCGQNATFDSPDGTHTLYFYTNDSLGNWASFKRTFSVSTLGPVIELFDPEDNTFLDTIGNVLFNYSAVDVDGVDTCSLWGTWNGGWHKNQSDSTVGAPTRNDADQSCSGYWGFDCSAGPAESADNTFNDCQYGAGNDESVNEVYLNATSVAPGDVIQVTCDFDPYTSADDTFIWYYNGTGWRKIFEHINWGSSSTRVNESATFAADNVAGTHWVRCSIVYDTDGDECANSGSWYDNDDLSFTVSPAGGVDNFTVNLTTDGTYLWNIECNDSGSLVSTATSNYTLGLDTQSPQISFVSPTEVNHSNKSQDWIFANVSVVEGNEANITFTLYDSTSLVNQTTYYTSQRTINWTNLDDDSYYYNVTIVDSASRTNSTETRRINLDTTAPFANLTAPENGTSSNETSHNLTVNTTDNSELYNATLYVYNESDLINQTTINLDGTEALLGIIYEFVYDGIFNWFYRIYDLSGNEETTENHTITIDTSSPKIRFVTDYLNYSDSHENASAYSGSPTNPANALDGSFGTYSTLDSPSDIDIIYANYTVPDALSSAYLEYLADWDLVAGKIDCYDGAFWIAVETLADNTRSNTSIPSTCYDQEFLQLRIYHALSTEFGSTNFYDVHVYWELESYTFADRAYLSQDWVSLNVYVDEPNEANITFRLYNQTALVNQTIATDHQRVINWTNLPDAHYYYNVSIMDTIGYLNYTGKRDIFLDTTDPEANLTTPENDTYSNQTSQNLTVNATDNLELENATIYIYNETDLINQTTVDIDGTEALLGIIYEFVYDGIFNWFYRIYDAAGNFGDSENNTITIDTTTPLLSFVSPTENNDTEFERDWIFVNVTASDLHEENITFSLFNSTHLINETTFTTPQRTINWTDLSTDNETYYYNVTVTDSLYQQNFSETRSLKLFDLTSPSLSLIRPKNQTYSTTSISLAYAVSDPNLGSCWYNLNGTNVSIFNCQNLSIEVFDEQQHTLHLYVNDTIGNSNYANVTFFVNTSFIETTSWLVQRGSDTVDGVSTQTLTEVDPQKTFVIHSTRSADAGPDSLQVTVQVTDSTTLELENYASGSGGNVEWETITGPNLSVQRNEESFGTSDSSLTVDINEINLSSSFIVVNARLNSGTGSENVRGYWSGRFFNASRIIFERGVTGDSGVLSWQVVEWAGANVQRGSISTADAGTSTGISEPVNLNNSIIIFSRRIEADSSIQDTLVQAQFLDSSQLYFNRYANGGTMYVDWFVVEWDQFQVESGNYEFTSTSAPQTVFLSRELLDTSKSFNVLSYESSGTGTTFSNGYVSQKIDNSSAIQLQKGTSSNLANASWFAVEIVEHAGPQINLVYPQDTLSLDVDPENFNFTVFDESTLINCSLYGNWSSGWHLNQTLLNPSNNVSLVQNFSSVDLGEGQYAWNVKCTDMYGNTAFNATNFTFFVDTIYPQISFVSPTENNDTDKGQDWIYVNVSVVEVNEANITFYLFNSTHLINETTYTNFQRTINWTSLPDAEYYYNVTIVDTVNHLNSTETRKLTLDSTAPSLNLTRPQNINYSYNESLPVNFTVSDGRLSHCWYNVNGGSNVSLPSCNNATFNAPQGSNTFYIFANDSVGNLNITSQEFFVDSVIPQISFVSPTEVNDSNQSRNWIYANVSVVETNEENITFRLYKDTVLINETTYTTPQRTINWTGLIDGTYYYNVTLTDTSLNQNSTETRKIYLDTKLPFANLTSPANDTISNQSSQNMTVNLSDNRGLGNATLYIYNETDLINETTVDLDGTEALLGIIYEFVYDGIFNWFYRLYDVAGNLDDTENFTIMIDTTYPQISFVSPTENNATNHTRNWIYANVSVTESNEANITFSLYNQTALVNQTTYTTSQRTINWTNLPDEKYFYNVSITDLTSQTNTTETRIINLDDTAPFLNIIRPLPKTYGYNESLPLDYVVSDNLVGLDSCWYNIDSGSNITLPSCNNMTFNTTEAPHTIRLFANDTLGNLASDSVTFSISLKGPAITLNNPENDSFYTEATFVDFNFTAEDPDGVKTCSLWGSWNGGWHKNQTNASFFGSADTTNQSCSGLWGFDCSAQPDSDNTWDSCATGANSDESVNEMWLNATSVKPGELLQITCQFQVWNNDDLYMWYYNGTGWKNVFQELNINLGTTTINRTVTFVADEVTGTHWIRCGLNYNVGTDTDSCVDGGSSYYDNDDLNFTVVEIEGNASFSVNLTNEGNYLWNIECNDSIGYDSFSLYNYTIGVDTQSPQISFVSPTEINNSNKSHNWIFANVSVTESNEANITFTLYDSTSLVNQTTYTTSQRTINWTNLADGAYYYNVTIVDKASRDNSTETRKIFLDTDAPFANLTTPANDTYTNESSQNLTVNTTENLELENATLYIYNETDLVNQTTVDLDGTEALLGIIYEFVYDGIFNWFYRIYDIAGNEETTENHTLILDTTYPQIAFIPSTENNDTFFEKDWIFANITVTEENFEQIIFDLYRQTEVGLQLENRTLSSNLFTEINWTNLMDENTTYFYEVTVEDKVGQTNMSERRKIKLADLTVPELYLTRPQNLNYSYSTALPINYTVNDTHLDSCWYNLDGGSNVSLASCNNATFDSPQGSHTFYIFVNDTAGNMNSSNVSFLVDSIVPKIEFIAPTPANGSNHSENYIFANLSLIEANVKNISYSLYQGNALINQTTYYYGQDSINWTNLPNGNYSFNATVFDVVGFTNSTEQRKILLDSVPPQISFVSPTENNDTEFERDWIFVNVTATETNEANITFSLYNSTSLVNQTTYNYSQRTINWTNLVTSNVTYYYNVTMVDVAYNTNSTETRTIELIDVSNPQLDMTSPENTTYSYNQGVPLTYTVTDANIGSCWYNLNGGSNISLPGCASTYIDVPDEALHTLYLFTNDTLGNMNSTNVTFYVNSSLILTADWVVQRGVTFVDDYTDVTIAQSDTTKSFILHNSRGSDSGPDSLHVTNDLVSPTLVRFQNYASGAGADIVWEVVTGPDLYVQRNQESYITTQSQLTLPINGINLSSSFIIVNNRLNSGTNAHNARGFWAAQFVNNTTIQLTRQQTGSAGVVSWQVVDWDGANVQRGSISDTSDTAFADLTNPVNLSRSFLIFSSSVEDDGASDAEDDSEDNWIKGNFTNASRVNFEREATGGVFYSEYFVVEADILETQSGDHTHSLTTSIQYDALDNTLINTSKTFNLNSHKNDGISSSFADSFITQKIINETTIGIQKGTSSSSGVSSWFAIEIVERDAPQITLTYPVNENFSSPYVPSFNYTSTDNSDLTECALYGNWSSGWHENLTNSTPSNSESNYFPTLNVTSDTYYSWNVKCTDIYGNIGWAASNASFSSFLPPWEPILFYIDQSSNDGQGNVTLYWNSSNHTDYYNIYSTSSLKTPFTLLGNSTTENFTDTTFSGDWRRFYIVEATNPIGQNQSSDTFGVHVYQLEHNTTSRNWIGFPSNFSYLPDANTSLNDITNATTFSLWNETIQGRVTCNAFSCPQDFECTDTNCNFKMQQGRGYETDINTTAPSKVNWSAAGIVYDATSIDLIKNSTSFGKNWIAMYANTTLLNAQGILDGISNSDATTNWDRTTQNSQGLIFSPWPWIPYLGTNFDIEIEKGYEVSVTQNVTWNQV